MNRTLRIIRQHRNSILLVMSFFIIPLFTNLTSSWLEKTVGESTTQILNLVAILLALIAVVYFVIFIAGRSGKKDMLERMEPPPPSEGLVLLIGPGRRDRDPMQGAAEPAIEYHKPKKIWLIASLQGAPVAEKLRDQYASEHCEVVIQIIQNQFDIHDTYAAVRQLIETGTAINEGQTAPVIFDFTGGTHPMAAGMVLACGDQWPMQYMSSPPGGISQPILVQFKPQ